MSSIPAPTDSYDYETSFSSNVTTLMALLLAFDAQMDTMNDAVEEQMQKLDRIEDECSNTLTKIESVKKMEGPLKITCPATYSSPESSDQWKEAPLARANAASRKAIHSVLKQAALEMENGPPARLSDDWLDHANAFDEENVCRQALAMNTVPPLRIVNSVKNIRSSDEIYAEETKYYRDALVKEALVEKEIAARMRHDDVSVLSEGAGTMYTNYSAVSTGTASNRRRQRKLAATMRKIKSNEGNSKLMSSVEEVPISSRQNFMNGSLAFACEAVHDMYYGTSKTAEK